MARTRGQFIALWDWKTGVHMMGGTSYKWATESLQGEQASRTTTPPRTAPRAPPKGQKNTNEQRQRMYLQRQGGKVQGSTGSVDSDAVVEAEATEEYLYE